MQPKQGLFRFAPSYRVRMFLCILAACCLIIASVTCFFYWRILESARKDLAAANVTAVRHLAERLSLQLSFYQARAYTLFTNSFVSSCLHADSRAWTDMRSRAARLIRHEAISDRAIRSIAVLHAGEAVLLTQNDVATQASLQRLWASLAQTGGAQGPLHLDLTAQVGGAPLPTLSVFFGVMEQGRVEEAVIINLNRAKLGAELLPGEEAGIVYYVVDAQRRVLLSHDPKALGSRLPEGAARAFAGEQSGAFAVEMEGKAKLAAFALGTDGSYAVLSFMDQRTAQRRLSGLNIYLLYGLAALGLASLLTCLMANALLRPMDELLQGLQSFSGRPGARPSSLGAAKRTLDALFVRLTQLEDTLDQERVSVFFLRHGQSEPPACLRELPGQRMTGYVLATLYIAARTRREETERIAACLDVKSWPVKLYHIDGQLYTLLLYERQGGTPLTVEVVRPSLERLLERLAGQGMPASLGVSRYACDLAEAPQLYAYAERLTRYGALHGPGRLYTAEDDPIQGPPRAGRRGAGAAYLGGGTSRPAFGSPSDPVAG